MVWKVALVGPPCSGKSTVLNLLQNEYNIDSSVNVKFLNEVATDLMASDPNDSSRSSVIRQVFILNEQISREEAILSEVDNDKDTILISDRSALDIFVYLSEFDIRRVLRQWKIEEILNRYDLLIFLITDGKTMYENIETNPYRKESSFHDLMAISCKTANVYMKLENPPVAKVFPTRTIQEKALVVAQTINEKLQKNIFSLK